MHGIISFNYIWQQCDSYKTIFIVNCRQIKHEKKFHEIKHSETPNIFFSGNLTFLFCLFCLSINFVRKTNCLIKLTTIAIAVSIAERRRILILFSFSDFVYDKHLCHKLIFNFKTSHIDKSSIFHFFKKKIQKL